MKTQYKRRQGKWWNTEDRLRHRGTYKISNNWTHWAKRSLNRSYRRDKSLIDEDN